MSKEKNSSDLYEALRNAGFQLETHLNDYIHKYLNKKEFAAAASVFKKAQNKLTDLLQEVHETASPHLNVPTKQDLANIAKLVIQVEEKVDRLSDQVEELTETVKRLNSEAVQPSTAKSSSASESPKDVPERWEKSIQGRLKRLETLKEMAAGSLKEQMATPAFSSEKLGNDDLFKLLDLLQRKKNDE
jgi:methyl-accepting chemotaxis protein